MFIVSVICLICIIFAGIRGIKTFTKGDERNVNRAFIWSIIILVLNIGQLIGAGFSAAITVALAIDIAYILGAFFVKFSK